MSLTTLELVSSPSSAPGTQGQWQEIWMFHLQMKEKDRRKGKGCASYFAEDDFEELDGLTHYPPRVDVSTTQLYFFENSPKIYLLIYRFQIWTM